MYFERVRKMAGRQGSLTVASKLTMAIMLLILIHPYRPHYWLAWLTLPAFQESCGFQYRDKRDRQGSSSLSVVRLAGVYKIESAIRLVHNCIW